MAAQDRLNIQCIFLGLSKQLDALAQRTVQLELATQKTVGQAESLSSSVIMHLQSFDYLRQSLQDLTTLTRLVPDYMDGAGLTQSTLKDISKTLSMTESKMIVDPNHRTERNSDVDHPGDTLIF